MLRDFKAFLLKQNVVALAIAVVLGASLNKLVVAVVDDFIMPFVGAATPGNAWKTVTFDVGPVKLGVGDFLSALVNFLIIGFVVWKMSKLFIRDISPENTMTKCPFCIMDVDKKARRCSHCTSELTAT